MDRDRIDVMYVSRLIQLKVWMSQIAAVISNYDLSSDLPPFGHPVQHLIQSPMTAKCYAANRSIKLQISEPLFEVGNLYTLTVRFHSLF